MNMRYRRADKALAEAVRKARHSLTEHGRRDDDDARPTLAFLSGYLEYEFPEFARKLDGVLMEGREPYWPFPDGAEQ